MNIVGYGYHGEIYCPSCMLQGTIPECVCDSRDENGVCDSNCSGYGPNPFFATDEQEDKLFCGGCTDEL